MFRVGQRVVCVDASIGARTGRKDLILGSIYTIRGISTNRTSPSVYIFEVALPKDSRGEIPFYASRFRPIVERKTDISIFTEILRRESAPSSLPLAEA